MATKPPEDFLQIAYDDLRRVLLPRLMGHVFHVTSLDRYRKISTDGAIRSNADGLLGDTYPQSAISLARKRGFTCLFDLRDPKEPYLEWGLSGFFFLAPGGLGDDIVFLHISPSAYSSIVTAEDVTEPGKLSDFHIPQIEVFFPGDIMLEHVERALVVRIDRPPVDPHGLEYLLALSHNPKLPRSPEPVSEKAAELERLLTNVKRNTN